MPKPLNDPELLARVGLRLQQARASRGVSQQTLAERCQIAVETLARYEGGHKSPSITTLDRAARALGLHLHDLMKFADDIPEADRSVEVECAARLLEGLSPERLELALRLLREVAR